MSPFNPAPANAEGGVWTMARRITAAIATLALVLMACTLDAQERFGSVAGTCD
jgi:hypothetical protein